jgi:hypothetical protein
MSGPGTETECCDGPRLREIDGWPNKRTLRDFDPLKELIRIVNEAQECDAEDEHRLYHSIRGDAGTARSLSDGFEPPASRIRSARSRSRLRNLTKVLA